MADQLTQAELIAAQMFFDVCVQSAFAVEDPNARFAQVFKRKEMIGYKAANSIEGVAHRIYKAELEGNVAVALETNPPKSPALSRVLAKGCRSEVLIDFLRDGLAKVEYFTTVDLGPLPKTDPNAGHPDDKSLAFRLDTAEHLGGSNNVLLVIAWRPFESGTDEMELSAMPINKPAPGTADTASQTA